MTTFVGIATLVEKTGISRSTWKRYRISGQIQEPYHFSKLPSGRIIYQLDLILDWIANQGDFQAHQRAIDNYLASLPSNQPRKAGRPAKRSSAA